MDIKDLIYIKIDEVLSRHKLPTTDWDNSTYERFWELEIDQRGQVGEIFCVEALRSCGCNVEYEKDKTGESKHWDLISDGMKLEVKLACRGKRAKTFQHENLDKTRLFDGIIIVDIAPEAIYLTCIAKKDLDWNSMHKRRSSILYKFDIPEKKLKDNNREVKTTDDFYQSYLRMKERING